jgi:SAM-dependent methyltransferase
MPGPRIAALMYGADYAAFSESPPDELDHRLGTALAALRQRPMGRLIDYGCGRGDLLRAAADLGWDCLGVEFSSEIASRLSADLGIPVVTPEAAADAMPEADVLMLNDVIEHVTDLRERFPKILGLIRPDGILVAQGPLEGNPNLFAHAIASFRRLGPSGISEMPPYHVLLATSQGQRTFFRRSGLRELEYTVTEVAWPAPSDLSASVVRNPRALTLFCLRRASQALGKAIPRYSGNRYFYVGGKSVRRERGESLPRAGGGLSAPVKD